MRLPLDARPRRLESGLGQTSIDVGLGGADTDSVVNAAVNAVGGDLVAGTERVGVVGEGAIGDAARGGGVAVAAEAGDGVENGGAAEFAGV